MDEENIKTKIYNMIKSKKILPSEGEKILEKLKSNNESSERVDNDKSTYYKAYVIDKPGDINDLYLRDIPIKEDINDDEVQIDIKAFSLNFGDLLCVRGLYPTMPDYPFVPGFEVSGLVRKVGKNVKNVKPGDEVIALTSELMGGHSTLVITKEIMVVKKPATVSFEEAAIFPVVYMTMDAAFEKAGIKQGDKVLIQTAAGGTGLISVQMCKNKGAQIYATASSNDKLKYLKKLGVDNLINYQEDDFENKVKELTNGKGVDVVVNTLSGDWIQKGLNILADGGRYIELAMTGLKTSHKLDLSKLTFNQAFYSVDFKKILINDPNMAQYYLKRMVKALEEGSVKPTIGKIFKFDDIKNAYRYLQDRKNIGKVVVTVEDKFKAYKNVEKEHISIDKPEKKINHVSGDIAVIGMSGTFPKSKNLDEFWRNIEEGIDCIEEVPSERWSIDKYYSEDGKGKNKTYSRWGGFLKDIDKFDGLFFNISGREAEMADPQHRVFLEQCWNALEDAGYANDNVSNKRCGIYVGAGSGDYQSLIDSENIDKEAHSFWGNSAAILSARIAYFLNLKGASITIDTACSSSLVAIHLACKSILNGENEMALAGGIYIANTPDFYIKSSNANMLSRDGRCKSFDDSADGFVYGEGAGAVILKSLDAAIRDKDNILAVIKGSEINQDGKTNGITAPSTVSQSELEKRVYDNLNLNPKDISYVETHGTGTKLGDPIEIEALTNVFREYTDEKNYCAIGSIKTNIGHAISAAGVASLIKVILCIKNKKIPKLLNFKNPNKFIDFENSPFYINTELEEWKERNGKRIAAISAFGFSGTNCHMIVEEFKNEELSITEDSSYEIITVSGKNKETLNEAVHNLLKCLKEKDYTLKNVAYTLNARRRHFNTRACFVVSSIEDLKEQLSKFKYDDSEINLEISESHKEEIENELVKVIESINCNDITEVDKKQKLEYIRKQYLSKIDVDFEKLYENKQVKVISMPTYPFQKKSYWLPKPSNNAKYYLDGDLNIGESFEKNELIFNKTIYRSDCIAKDHIVNDRLIVPGVVHLELINLALSKLNHKYEINNIAWLSTLDITDENKDIQIVLRTNKDKIDFEIISVINEKVTIHSKGEAVKINKIRDKKVYDINKIKERCCLGSETDKPYKKLEVMGIKYGPFFTALQSISKGSNEALAYISLNELHYKSFNQYLLHPSIMDAALQATIGVVKTKEGSTALPFSLGHLEILNKIDKNMYAYISNKNKQNLEFDIELLNLSGEVCVRFNNISFREMKNTSENVIYKVVWEKIEESKNKSNYDENALIIHSNSNEALEIVHGISNFSNVKEVILDSELEGISNEALYKNISTIYYLDTLINVNNQNTRNYSDEKLLRLFKVIKLLQNLKVNEKSISFKVITNNVYDINLDLNENINYYSGAVNGFVKSMSKEFIKWTVSLIDITIPDNKEEIKDICKKIFEEDNLESVIRGDSRFYRAIKPLNIKTLNDKSLLKMNGVYVIVGGTGGIGFETAKYLVKNYNSKVIVIGRNNLKPDKEAEKGNSIEYVKADCTDRDSFINAINSIRDKYGKINGVIHSAIVLSDMYIQNMNENDLLKVLKVKTLGTINIYESLKNQDLDFILFFSSAQSFAANPGQSNYAAACTFEDVFAGYLRRKMNCPIKIINWGFWGQVGIVSSSRYNESLAKTGLIPLKTTEGLKVFNDFMKTNLDEIIAIKAQRDLLIKQNFKLQDKLEYCPGNINVDLFDIFNNLKNELDDFNILTDFEIKFKKLEEFVCELISYIVIDSKLFKDLLISKNEIYDYLNIESKYLKIMDAFIDILVRENKLIKEENKFRVNLNMPKKDIVQLTEDKEYILEHFPEFKNHMNLIWSCFINYKEILQGKVKATDVIFPKAGMNLVEGIYKGNIIADYCNKVVAKAAEKYIENAIHNNGSNKLRILEIGAGTGGTSAIVLKVLNKYSDYIKYDYTDISMSFTNFGRDKFKEFNFVDYKVLNIEEDLLKQNFELNSYDIVISTNVLHATKNINVTLKNIKQLLKNGGILLNNEATRAHYFTTFTFGLLEGWWLFEDKEHRLIHSPLLSVNKWNNEFAKTGLYSSEIISSKIISGHDFGQDVFIALSDGINEEKMKSAARNNYKEKVKAKEPIYEEKKIIKTETKKPETKINIDEIKENLNKKIISILAEVLCLEEKEIDLDTEYVQYGVDSLLSVNIIQKINEILKVELNATDLFNYSTVTKLSEYIFSLKENNIKSSAVNEMSEYNSEEMIVPNVEVQEPEVVVKTPLDSEEVIEKIRNIIEEILHLERNSMDIDQPYVDYGIDSLLSVNIIQKINEEFNINLRETEFFNYATVSELSQYIIENFELESHEENIVDVEVNHEETDKSYDTQATYEKLEVDETDENNSLYDKYSEDDIAIIGISGKFAQSDNVEELWRNIVNGKDCVHEIKRWPLEDYYDEDVNAKGKSYSKWGGFLDDPYEFDSMFFNITPNEAISMDPQQRLFLQEAWNALEDSGYSQDKLSGNKCGVFVGCGSGDYNVLLRNHDKLSNAYGFMGNSQSILSARISYFLNLRGASLSVDTACSSSLVALTLACDSIKSGGSNLAIVGGVSVMNTPEFYIFASKAGMLSKTGRCKAFSDYADGFVPGEGSGAIVIKKLKDAIRDKDNIYAIVSAYGTNQDGKTNGITAPSAPSQRDLEKEVYDKFNINPESISYIETHGTGTKLGDPIEVQALTEAFESYTDKKNFCALGSVKSNIGHALTASGIASILKVVLSMKNDILPKTLHAEKVNQYIKIDNSPFYIIKENKKWSEIAETKRAAISSFGFSGTNAHVIITEYKNNEQIRSEKEEFNIVTISAKTKSAFNTKCRDLLKWLTENKDRISCNDMAYTSNYGRTHFAYRAAIIVKSNEEMLDSLNSIINEESRNNVLVSNNPIKNNGNSAKKLECEELVRTISNNSFSYDKLIALGRYYMEGMKINWKMLYENTSYKTISMPKYPFEKDVYTLDYNKKAIIERENNMLIDKNISTFMYERFSKTLKGTEFYVKDHVINNQKVMPGAAYVEMICEAVKMAGVENICSLEDIKYLLPLYVNKELTVEIDLQPDENNDVKFAVTSKGHKYCLGKVTSGTFNNVEDISLNIKNIKEYYQDKVERNQIYDKFKEMGVVYGESFRGIKVSYMHSNEILSEIECNNAHINEDYLLNPALLDMSLQTIINMDIKDGLYLPYKIGRINIAENLNSMKYVYTVCNMEKSNVDEKVFDIYVLSSNEKILCEIKNFTVRKVKKSMNEEDRLMEILKAVKNKTLSVEEAVGELYE